MVMAGKNGAIHIGGQKIGYIDNFSINVNQGSAETSQIGKQWRDYISTCSDWSGTLSGTLDYGNPAQKVVVDELSNPSDVALTGTFKVGEDLTYTGRFFITSISITGSFADKVAVSINFQGDGELTMDGEGGEGDGTADNPIAYRAGVTVLQQGLYYSEAGKVYLCIASLSAPVAYTLAVYVASDEGAKTVTATGGNSMWLGVGLMGDNVAFDNPEGLTLTSSDGFNFTAEGELSAMTAEQAEAFGWPGYSGSRYISLYIKALGADNPVSKQGWVSDKDSDDFQTSKSGSTDPGKILAVTMGEALRTDTNGCFVWKCILTDGQVYTVDLRAQASTYGGD